MTPQATESILTRARQVSLLALDCDGVLTDGRLYYSNSQDGAGSDSIFGLSFNSQDGQAIKMLMRSGVEVAVISGRRSDALDRRAKELGIAHVYSKVEHKGRVLRDLMHRLKVESSQVAAMGDDVPDLALFALAGLTLAPSDAHPLVCEQADLVTHAGGGRGCVREAAHLIMTAQDSLKSIIESFVRR